MATTAEMILSELEKSADELLLYGQHDGVCTNEHQVKLSPKVPACTKHHSAMKAREERFKRALQNFKLLRDVFGTSDDKI